MCGESVENCVDEIPVVKDRSFVYGAPIAIYFDNHKIYPLLAFSEAEDVVCIDTLRKDPLSA